MLCFHAAQTGKHLLRAQNVSEQNQKHFLCPGHNFVPATNIARAGKRGNNCVGNNVSATMSKTIAVHVHYKSLYISLPSSAKQQREMSKF